MTEVARVLGNNGKYWILDININNLNIAGQKELTDNDSGRQGVGNRGSERFRELRMTQDPFPEGRLASPTTKTDEFSEKFQTVFAPPPSFSENHVANLYQCHAQKALFQGPKSARYIFGLKMTHPFGPFPKIHHFGDGNRP